MEEYLTVGPSSGGCSTRWRYLYWSGELRGTLLGGQQVQLTVFGEQCVNFSVFDFSLGFWVLEQPCRTSRATFGTAWLGQRSAWLANEVEVASPGAQRQLASMWFQLVFQCSQKFPAAQCVQSKWAGLQLAEHQAHGWECWEKRASCPMGVSLSQAEQQRTLLGKEKPQHKIELRCQPGH